MRIQKLLSVALVLAVSSTLSAQIDVSRPRKVTGELQSLTKHVGSLAPVSGDAYGIFPGGCSLDPLVGGIFECFSFLGDDPVTGQVFAVIDGMENPVGVDLVAGEGVVSGDTLTCLGDDGSGSGAERFVLELTLRSESAVTALIPGGFTGNGNAITEPALFMGPFLGADDLLFDAPPFVESGLVDFFDINGDSLTGGVPADLDITVFFQDLVTNPDGDWPGDVGVAFGGPIDDTIFGLNMVVTYTAMSTCPAMDGCPSGFAVGDVDMNGSVDLLDVGPFVQAILDGVFVCEADANEDGTVDLLDVGAFVELILGG